MELLATHLNLPAEMESHPQKGQRSMASSEFYRRTVAEAGRPPGDTIAPPVPTFPEWWTWELSFTGHAEMRMEQRGVTEVELRAMLERATGVRPNVVEGRFMIDVRHESRPWIVIVEPDAEAQLLVVVTVYEVCE